jgi:hypothetical protein
MYNEIGRDDSTSCMGKFLFRKTLKKTADILPSAKLIKNINKLNI